MEFISISKFDPTLSLDKLQNLTEGQYFERKSEKIATKDFAHQLSAFANASGGVIAVGVEDDGTITGVTAEHENDFRKAAIDHLRFPPHMEIEKVLCNDTSGAPCSILLFHIRVSPDEIICMKNGDAYLRIGDTSHKLTPQEFTALEYSRGIKSYESRIISDATMDDLDENLIRQYVEILGLSASTALDVLKARGLLKREAGNWKLTVAAILLFGRHPTQFLPSARIRFLRYEGLYAGVGISMNLIKDVTIEKPLSLAIAEGQQLLKSQMREFQRLGMNGKFVRVPEYPDFAWLEGLVNAVTHRDYSIQGDYIRITMYDDRIEFRSPGRLPSIVTVENIQNTRFSRNPVIARVLSDFGWVRELNEGVKRIYVDMNNFFLDPPVFSEPNGNTVELELKNNIAARSLRNIESCAAMLENIWSKLSAIDRQIVFYIANMERCTPSELTTMLGRTRPTVSGHVKKLIELGIVEEHSTAVNDPTKYYTIRRK